MFQNKVSIGDKLVGQDAPCYVTAEAGGNHNLNFAQAVKLIDIAADSGADAVKFILSRAATQYPPNAGSANYLGENKPIYDIVKDREVPYNWIPKLKQHSEAKRIEFLCSSFDEKTTAVLSENHISAFKIASYEATHIPLVRLIAGYGKPVIMSLGVTTMDEARESIQVIADAGNDQLILMHCVGAYPAPIEDANLSVIQALKEEFGCPVGVSDHTREPSLIPAVAVTLGADIVEKHYTISNQLPGPDHSFALEPDELRAMVHSIRMAEAAIGDPRKAIAPCEKELHQFARRTIFSRKKIGVGDVLSPDNIIILRCGQHKVGFQPKEYDNLIGRKVAFPIEAFEVLNAAHID